MKRNLKALVLLFAIAGLTAIAAAEPAPDAAPAGFDQERDVPHGDVAAESYDSKSLGFERKLTVSTLSTLVRRRATTGTLVWV